MGYRMVYSPDREQKLTGKRLIRIFVMTSCFLIAFCMLVKLFWPQGAEMLRGFFITDDLAVIEAIVEEAAKQMRAGEKITEILDLLRNRMLRLMGK